MAKVNIKIGKITPFGGIFPVTLKSATNSPNNYLLRILGFLFSSGVVLVIVKRIMLAEQKFAILRQRPAGIVNNELELIYLIAN